jgi:hypothetical protein
VRYPVSKTGGPFGPWGFDSLSFRSRRHGRAGKAARCYRVGGVQPFAGSSPAASVRSGVVELERRAVVTRESAGSSPAAGALAPVVEAAMTPGPQPGSCGFESRRGYSLIDCWL